MLRLTAKKTSITGFENPSLKFAPILINLSERDADEALQRISDKLEQGEPINELEIIYLPLYTSKTGKTMAELAGISFELVEKVAEQEEKEKEKKKKKKNLDDLLLLLMARCLTGEEFERIVKRNMVDMEYTDVVKIVGKVYEERGIEKGRAEAREEKIQVAKELLKSGVEADTVARATKFPMDEVLKLAG